MGKAVKKFKLGISVYLFGLIKIITFRLVSLFHLRLFVWKSRYIVTHRAGLAVGGVVTLGRAAGTLQHTHALLHEAGVGPDPGQEALHLGLAHPRHRGLDVGQL